MAVDVVMPQMGESIFEGTITKWLKKPGDKVERDEPLFEISTDKVDAEIPSPSAGVLKEIKIPEGQTVPIQTIVAVIDGAVAAPASMPAPAPTSAAAKPAPSPAPAAPAASGAERIHSSPLVRRLAKEHGVDLGSLEGTGAGGRITKQDIEAVIAAQSGAAPAAPPSLSGGPVPSAAARPTPPTPPPAPAATPGAPAVHGSQFLPALQVGVPRERIYFGNYEVQPLSVMRQKIAEHMVASKHVSPHVYSVDEIDMTKIAAIRAKAKAEFEQR